MFLKRKASDEAIEQYEKDRLALRLVRAELEEMRLRHSRNLAVEKELTRVIRRVEDALGALYILIGE